MTEPAAAPLPTCNDCSNTGMVVDKLVLPRPASPGRPTPPPFVMKRERGCPSCARGAARRRLELSLALSDKRGAMHEYARNMAMRGWDFSAQVLVAALNERAVRDSQAVDKICTRN
jgi:hypothetical protein